MFCYNIKRVILLLVLQYIFLHFDPIATRPLSPLVPIFVSPLNQITQARANDNCLSSGTVYIFKLSFLF